MASAFEKPRCKNEAHFTTETFVESGINRGAMAVAAKEDWGAEVDRVLREGEETLDLAGKFLSDVDSATVAEKLRGSSNSVEYLELSRNRISDGGARAVAELLRSNPPALEFVSLSDNRIGGDGISALAAALRENTTVRVLYLGGNKGVDPDPHWGGIEAEAAAGIESLLAAIGVNTTLEKVGVNVFPVNPYQKPVNAALADTEGRRAGRELFRSDLPMTKSAGKRG
jgi:Leucine Rich repeat